MPSGYPLMGQNLVSGTSIPSGILPANGAATPESVKRRRRLAESLMQSGMDTSPVASPWQAVGRIGQAAIGGYSDYQAGQQEEEGRKSAQAKMSELLQGGSPDNASIMEAMDNPWLSEGQGRLASALMEQNFKKAQPDWQTFTDKGSGDVYRWNQNDQNAKPEMFFDAPAAGGDPTDDMREYQFYVQQAEGAGQPPLPFTEWMMQMRKAGATSINMPGQPNIGSIPQGWQAVQDQKTGAWSMSPIQGGPAAAEADANAKAEQNRTTSEQQRGDLITQEIDRALGVMNTGMLPDTGWGSMISGVPGTDAKALSSLLETVKANIGFGELNKMRQQSPTGGALGNVTERELQYLQAVAGSLDQSQGQEQLTDNLNRLWNAYQDVINGPGQGPERRPLIFEQQPGQQPAGRVRIDLDGNQIQ